MLDFLRELRNITSTERGCTRIAYGELEDEAHALAWRYVSDIEGLERVTDAAGNTFIVPHRALSPERVPIVLIGSHLDTVIEGGWLDGALGVAAGLAVLRQVHRNGASPPIGVAIFRDEEGVRFRNGLFGSRVFAGLCQPSDLDAVDHDGQSLRSVVPDPDGCVSYEPPVKTARYLECHIEQGRRLDERGVRVGVVTGIVGIRRYHLQTSGAANHAGTTEMHRRRDALVPMCRLIADLPGLFAEWQDAVITCGKLDVSPGAPNVVPGTVDAVVETRAQTTEGLDAIEKRLLERITVETERSSDLGVSVTVSRTADIKPVHTDANLQATLRDLLYERAISSVDLPSMAGHDTQHATTTCPAAMFFIPSLDGVSHNPGEASREEDIVLAGEVMQEWAQRCLAAMRIA